jgi:hypothetical protein
MSAFEELFPENPLRRDARNFAASIQAHALLELGFEESINDYEPRELLLISLHVAGSIRDALRKEALERSTGDERRLIEEALDG